MGKKLNKTGFVELNGVIYPTFTTEVDGVEVTCLDYPTYLPKPYVNNKSSMKIMDDVIKIAKKAGYKIVYNKTEDK